MPAKSEKEDRLCVKKINANLKMKLLSAENVKAFVEEIAFRGALISS